MRGITTINIGGEIRTLSLKNNFLVLLGVQLGCDPLSIPAKIAELGTENPFQIITLVIYCGLIANMDREANFAHFYTAIDEVVPDPNIEGKTKVVTKGVPLTLKQVAIWMDDASDAEMKSVWGEFAEIMDYPKASEEQIAAYQERIKKNSTQPEKQPRKSRVK